MWIGSYPTLYLSDSHPLSVNLALDESLISYLCTLWDEDHKYIKGALKKICTNSHKKRKGGGSANAPDCARSASDPRARPFFPLSATKAFRTTALVLVSQGFGCPTVVQDLSKRVQWRGRELSNSAVIVCGRQACSGSKTLRFFSPCDGDVHAVRSGVPCMPLIFTTSGSLGKAKWDLCVFFNPLPCPFHWNLVSAGVCKASQTLESIITSDLELSLFFSAGTGEQ